MKFLRLYEAWVKSGPRYIPSGAKFKSKDPNDDAIYKVIGSGETTLSYNSDKDPEVKRDKIYNFLKNYDEILEPLLEPNTEDTIPEVGSRWINKENNIAIVHRINNNLLYFYLLNDPSNLISMYIREFLCKFIPKDKDIYRDDIELDFNKSVYIADEKAIIGAFYIKKETDKAYEILNIKEYQRDSVFMDGADPYSVSIHTTFLPKSQCKIIKPVESKEGFFYIKVPYWLYKEKTDLQIKRLPVRLKRISIKNDDYNKKDFLKMFGNPHVIKYFQGSNPDKLTNQHIESYAKHGNLS
jgi:hypothetical protein